MNPRDHKIMEERKRNLERRLDRENLPGDLDKPVLRDLNVHYEMSGRARAVGCGGIAAIHKMVSRLRLDRAIIDRCISNGMAHIAESAENKRDLSSASIPLLMQISLTRRCVF